MGSSVRGQEDTLVIHQNSPPKFASPPLYMIPETAIQKLASDTTLSSDTSNTFLGNPIDRTNESPGSTLEYRGIKTLGFTVGQDGQLALGSVLRLRIKGEIAQNIFLEGFLSDQDLPLESQGQTATLRELDEVYLRLHGSVGQMQLGDLRLNFGKENVDRLTVNTQGVLLEYTGKVFTSELSLSKSKGVVVVNTFKGEYGKRKDYYLRGKNGESQIAVLTGSEKLWRNGILLERGRDYQIEYTEGRIDFLGSTLIKGDDEFQAEFQYTLREYPQVIGTFFIRDTSLHTGVRLAWTSEEKKGEQSISIAEQDQKNFSLLPPQVYRARTQGFAEPFTGKVWQNDLYRREQNTFYWIDSLSWRNDSDQAGEVYRVEFSPSPSGSYIKAREGYYVYKGKGEGSFDPGRVVRMPQQRIHSALWWTSPDSWGQNYRHQTQAEGRLSVFQPNNFKDNYQMEGYALELASRQEVGRTLGEGGLAELSSQGTLKFLSALYEPLSWSGNNYLWNRIWGLPDSLGKKNMRSAQGELRLRVWNPWSVYVQGGAVYPFEGSTLFNSRSHTWGAEVDRLENWRMSLKTENRNTRFKEEKSQLNQELSVQRLNDFFSPSLKIEKQETRSRSPQFYSTRERVGSGASWQAGVRPLEGKSDVYIQRNQISNSGKKNLKDSLRWAGWENSVAWRGAWQNEWITGLQYVLEYPSLEAIGSGQEVRETWFRNASWDQNFEAGGLYFQSLYSLEQTEAIPRLSRYIKVPEGTGSWQCRENPLDTLVRECWESRLGSYDLVGWYRDTTRGPLGLRENKLSGSYRWVPLHSFKNLTGLLRDSEFFGSFEFTGQDSSTGFSFLPPLSPKQIRDIYAGSLYIDPSFLWKHQNEQVEIQITGQYRYNQERNLGLSQFSEKGGKFSSLYRPSLDEEFQLKMEYFDRDRKSFTGKEKTTEWVMGPLYERGGPNWVRTQMELQGAWLTEHLAKGRWVIGLARIRPVFFLRKQAEVYAEAQLRRLYTLEDPDNLTVSLVQENYESLVLERLMLQKGYNWSLEGGWSVKWNNTLRTTSSIHYQYLPADGRWLGRIQANAEAVF